MNAEVKIPLAVAAVYLWIGFVSAISFMEAWLKFRAPGVTLPVGLGIGRLVFNALNKTEWVFAITIVTCFIISKESFFTPYKIAFYIPFVLLLVQTIWLLPALDARAEMRMQNLEVPASNIHFYYVAAEILKVICLTFFSLKLFK